MNQQPEKLKANCFIDLAPEFAKGVAVDDFVVGGANFGCGSSREAAPVAIKMTGVKIVIAESFARIFYRNCINVGLLALESSAASAGIRHGDVLEVDSAAGVIRNLSTRETYSFTPIPPFVQQVLDLGGLVPYVKQRLAGC